MFDIKDNSGLFFYYTRFVLILIPETLLSTGFRIEGVDSGLLNDLVAIAFTPIPVLPRIIL